MEYISTRNKNLNYNFKDIFLRGLAPDGGLFIPKKIKTFNKYEIKELSKLILHRSCNRNNFNFCSPEIDKNNLKNLIEKSYKNFIN